MDPLKQPEVQNALRVLAKHDMGAMHIHMHDEDGDIVPLEENMVQLEDDQVVTFVNNKDERLNDATPVGWQWKNGKIEVTAYCKKNHGRCRKKT